MPEVTKRDDQPFEEFERQPEPARQERGRLSRKRRAGAAPVDRPGADVGLDFAGSGWPSRTQDCRAGNPCGIASASSWYFHEGPGEAGWEG